MSMEQQPERLDEAVLDTLAKKMDTRDALRESANRTLAESGHANLVNNGVEFEIAHRAVEAKLARALSAAVANGYLTLNLEHFNGNSEEAAQEMLRFLAGAVLSRAR